MNAIGIARKTFIAAFLAVTLLPTTVLMTAYSRVYMPGLKSALDWKAFPPRTEFDMLVNSRWGWYRVIDFVNRFLPADALILVFRQNDIVFYGKRRVIRDVDPRMIAVYQQPGKEEAYLELVRLGVNFFYLPEYSVATEYNTPVGKVLADPEMVRLVFEASGTRLYRLIPPSARRRLATNTVLGEADDWKLSGGQHDWNPVKLPYKVEGRGTRSRMIWLQSGPGNGDWLVSPSSDLARRQIVPGSTFVFTCHVKGTGWLTLHIIEYPRSSAGRLTVRTLHRGAVNSDQLSELSLQFRSRPSAGSFRFLVTFEGEDSFIIGPIEVREISEKLPYGLKALGSKLTSTRRGLGDGSVLNSNDDISLGRFTGPGHYLVPPSVYGIQVPRIPEIGNVLLYRVHLEVSGRGNAQLAAVSFDVDGIPHATSLETISMSPDSATIERVLILPLETREFRFGVIPIGGSGPSLLDWTKQYFWHQRPPSMDSFSSIVSVHELSINYAPEILGESGLRDCVLENLKAGKSRVPSLCQP